MRTTLFIKKYLRRLGYDLIKFNPVKSPVAQRKALLDAYGIDLVLDVGANIGDFGEELRSFGYAGRILSFEPLHETYRILERKTRPDPKWEARNEALGDVDAERPIHVSQNTQSSSLLNMLETHKVCEPDSCYVGTESIRVRRLDSIFSELQAENHSILLKIDTQGYERWVLEGARESLRHIDSVQLEVSLVPLYEGGFLFPEILASMAAQSFQLVGVETVFTHPRHGETLQLDAFFHRGR